jgi:hypothetical protein
MDNFLWRWFLSLIQLGSVTEFTEVLDVTLVITRFIYFTRCLRGKQLMGSFSNSWLRRRRRDIRWKTLPATMHYGSRWKGYWKHLLAPFSTLFKSQTVSKNGAIHLFLLVSRGRILWINHWSWCHPS